MTTYLYTRKSTEHSQENSHETQRAECEAYAQAHGLTIDVIFEDTCSGGVAPYERPAFSEMLDHMTLLKEFYSPFSRISPGLVGMEDCESLFTHLKNRKMITEKYLVRHFLPKENNLFHFF